jgi:hypothetical protein
MSVFVIFSDEMVVSRMLLINPNQFATCIEVDCCVLPPCASAASKMYVRFAAFLPEVDMFDASLFRFV